MVELGVSDECCGMRAVYGWSSPDMAGLIGGWEGYCYDTIRRYQKNG